MQFPLEHLFLVYVFMSHASAGIFFPGELGTTLGLLYSYLPPAKIGTDSRIGFGFRLGRNADAQFLIELGPQTNTLPLQTSQERKRWVKPVVENSFSGKWKDIFSKRYKYNAVTRGPNALDVAMTTQTSTTTTTTTPAPTTTKTTTAPSTTEALVEKLQEKTVYIDLPVYLSDKFLVSDRLSSNDSSKNSTLELIHKYKQLYPVFSVNVFKLVNSLMHILPESKTSPQH